MICTCHPHLYKGPAGAQIIVNKSFPYAQSAGGRLHPALPGIPETARIPEHPPNTYGCEDKLTCIQTSCRIVQPPSNFWLFLDDPDFQLSPEAFQYYGKTGPKQQVKGGVPSGVEGVEPKAGGIGGHKGLPVQGLDEGRPEPQVHNPPEKIAPDKIENRHATGSYVGINYFD